MMDEQTVQDFWQSHACGDALVGGLKERFGGDYEKFLTDYDQSGYLIERHLPGRFDALNVRGKRVHLRAHREPANKANAETR